MQIQQVMVTLTHRLDLYHHLKKLGTNSATRVPAQINVLHGAGEKVAQFSNSLNNPWFITGNY